MTGMFKTLVAATAMATVFANPGLAEDAKKGGTLTMSIPQTPRHLNPAVQSGTATGVPGTQLFASPLRYELR